MPVTIEQLNAKYSAEDPVWDFSLFPSWLLKKGIPDHIQRAALQKALAEYTSETLPDLHHDFDNEVLQIAQRIKADLDRIVIQQIESNIQEGFAKYEADWNQLSRVRKLWEVLRGRA